MSELEKMPAADEASTAGNTEEGATNTAMVKITEAGARDLEKPLSVAEFDEACETLIGMGVALPKRLHAGFPWVTQKELRIASGRNDPKNFRDKLHALGIFPDEKFGHAAFYRIDGIAGTIAALRPKQGKAAGSE